MCVTPERTLFPLFVWDNYSVFSGEYMCKKAGLIGDSMRSEKSSQSTRCLSCTGDRYLDEQAILTVEKFTACDAGNFVWFKDNNNKRIIGIVTVNSYINLSFAIESVMNNLGIQKQLKTKSWVSFQVDLFCFLFFINCSQILKSADSENSDAPNSKTLLWTW